MIVLSHQAVVRIIFLAEVLGSFVFMTSAGACHAKVPTPDMADIYFVDQGQEIRKVGASIFESTKEGEKYSKITVIGNVRKPGLYFFEGSASILEIVEFAGRLYGNENNSTLSQTFILLRGEDQVRINFQKAREMMDESKGLPDYLKVRGGETIYRLGVVKL